LPVASILDTTSLGPQARSRAGVLRSVDFAWAAGVVVVSRLMVYGAGVAALLVLHYPGRAAALKGGLARSLLIRPWTHWDGSWFLLIAQRGYARRDTAAFFPLYPVLVRGLERVVGSYAAAALTLSLVCYLAAMLVLYLLVTREFGTRVAAMTVTLVSLFPTALVFGAAYSESLFLLLTVGCFLLASHRRWLLAGLVGALASLTRSTGILLVPALVLLYGRQQGWTWRRLRPAWPRDLRLASVALVPLGLLGYMAYLWRRTGDPLRFSAVEKIHWHRALAWPWADVRRAITASSGAFHYVARSRLGFTAAMQPAAHAANLLSLSVLPLATLVFAAIALALGLRKLPAAYTLYGALVVAFPLFYPSTISPLYSFHRFTLVAFPLFIALSLRLKRHLVAFWVVSGASATVMIWLAASFALHGRSV
jgi:hypothetical protein